MFVRADLNVPLDKQLNITDDTRIRAAVPTLKYLMDNGAKVLLTSHLVRGTIIIFACNLSPLGLSALHPASCGRVATALWDLPACTSVPASPVKCCIQSPPPLYTPVLPLPPLLSRPCRAAPRAGRRTSTA